MAVYRFEDPGMKNGMDALAGIMRAAGEYSRQKQDHEMNMKALRIASDPTRDPETKLQDIYSEFSNYKQQRSPGLAGIGQGIGNFFAPPSQVPTSFASSAIKNIMEEARLNRASQRSLDVRREAIPIDVDRAAALGGEEERQKSIYSASELNRDITRSQALGAETNRQAALYAPEENVREAARIETTGTAQEKFKIAEEKRRNDLAIIRDSKDNEDFVRRATFTEGRSERIDEKEMENIAKGMTVIDELERSGIPLSEILPNVMASSKDEKQYKRVVSKRFMEEVKKASDAMRPLEAKRLAASIAKNDAERKKYGAEIEAIIQNMKSVWGSTHGTELKKAGID